MADANLIAAVARGLRPPQIVGAVANARSEVAQLKATKQIADDRTFVHGPLGSAELVEIPRFPPARREEIAGGCVAPMPGVVRQVCVAVGDRVEKGAVLLVLEAMKMDLPLIAHAPGVVKEVRVEVGQMVDPDAVLIVVEGEQ